MPASIIDLYDQLTDAPDDRARARILAQAFETLETRYPHISELATPELATRTHLSETELKLTKEIEQVRLKVTRVRSDLGRDIEHARGSLLLLSFGFWVTQLVVLLTLLWRLWPMAAS